jgi:hypothetical protein
MRIFILIALINSVLIGCVVADSMIQPELYKQAFPGFEFNQKEINTAQPVSGYQYQSTSGNTIDIHNCKQASAMDSALIAEFEYFRFQQLLLSCQAMEQYARAGKSRASYFPQVFDKQFYEQLPAIAAPLLGEADLDQRQGKSFTAYETGTQVTIEPPHTAKLLTAEDEIYITILARGDFNGDGIEDLLVKSEWYARQAFGKHADLLILAKTDTSQVVKINWRLNAINKKTGP